MFKVLVAEDEKIIRQGLQALITNLTNDFAISGEAEDGERALELLRHNPPDVLLTDIRMPKMDGLSLIEKAKEINPSLSIIIISGYDDFEYAKIGLKHGVHDYLLKPINRREFVKAMESVHQKLKGRDGLTSGTSEQSPSMNKISRYMWQNMDRDLSLSTISNLVHLHPGYFSQWFKKETGINFSEYLTDLRIKKAKQLLLETELKVYEVAELVGYQSEKHFLKTFKKRTEKTPSEYRHKRNVSTN
ncbi:response regulator [Radiobacillus kanasensis]|uniref:response regulator transcription factor n=1 Tax=Radiobacillus kanasensis TaxID=2844358 RepID=UPI001E571D35|nr:response regulator [Radiobacillus kanasensis]UFT98688.1 response regulator [Radiobacillus kanasensis]